MPAHLQRMISFAAARVREAGARLRGVADTSAGELVRLCDALLARRGEPWAASVASDILAGYEAAGTEKRQAFLATLAERYGADPERLDRAIAAYQARRDAQSMAEIHAASLSRRQVLIQELNQAPGGTLMLLRMRQDGLSGAEAIPGYDVLDADFQMVLASWFNRGFLTLRRIEWSSPASLLRRLIDYEAVHEIRDWEDLRRRVEPKDRRCYAFFHPQLPDEPLIFVEVALTSGIPDSIQGLLAESREMPRPQAINTAVLYSISNCQEGLRGIPFGSFLIKQAAEVLQHELPQIKTLVTLSPIPGFRAWLERENKSVGSKVMAIEEREVLSVIDDAQLNDAPSPLRDVLMSVAARYLMLVGDGGRPLDTVARFHIGNGAQLDHIRWLADTSEKGMRQSYGLMVNYLYDLKHIEQNQAALSERGEVTTSPAVKRLARAEFVPRERNGAPPRQLAVPARE